MKRLAVPLFARGSGDAQVNIGTGFLTESGDITWLLTAAHVPTNRQPTRANGWDGWPVHLTAHISLKDVVQVKLFDTRGPSLFDTRRPAPHPLFRYQDKPGGGERLNDMMAIPGTGPNEASIAALRGVWEPLSLGGMTGVTGSDPLTVHGYPNTHPRWPYEPAAQNGGAFLNLDGRVYEADMTVARGYSGGPVTLADGALLGMVIGTTNDDLRTRIVPGHELAALIS